jgi:hypothetical protein
MCGSRRRSRGRVGRIERSVIRHPSTIAWWVTPSANPPYGLQFRSHPSDAAGDACDGRWRSKKLWKVSDIVDVLEQRELANFKPEYQFIVRQYLIGKGHSVSVMWRGGEIDTIFGFKTENDALEWVKEKSRGWLLDNRGWLLDNNVR